MNYNELEAVNKSLKPIPLQSKKGTTYYVPVNEQVKGFRQLYPNGSIQTELNFIADGVACVKATVCDDNGGLLATGTAYEKENSTFINKTSYIENCETSAVGRALSFLGIGIDESISSYEEVMNAKANQDAEPKKPTYKKQKTVIKEHDTSSIQPVDNGEDRGQLALDLLTAAAKVGYDKKMICNLLHVESITELNASRLVDGIEYFRQMEEEKNDDHK